MTSSAIEHRYREEEYYRKVLPQWIETTKVIHEMQRLSMLRFLEILEKEKMI